MTKPPTATPSSLKILLAADGSAFTRNAALHLVNQARMFVQPPEVHVLYVHASLPYPAAAGVAGKAAVDKYYREESEAALAVAQVVLTAAGVLFIASWKVGDVTEQIAKYVKEHDIDLVVMGSHGRGALANVALGSVATKCIATLEVPILIVRKEPVSRPLTRREKIFGPARNKSRVS